MLGAGGNLYLYYTLSDFCSFLNENEVEKTRIKSYFKNSDDIAFSKLFDEKHYLKEAEDCFFALQELIDDEKISSSKSKLKISFYFGSVGFHTIGAFLFSKLNDKKNFQFCVENILDVKKKMAKLPPETIYDELLYGLSGYLYCLLALQKEFQLNPKVKPEYKLNLENYVYDIMEDLMNRGIQNFQKDLSLEKMLESQKFPENFHLVYTFHDRAYIGGAHGFFGVMQILYTAYSFNKNYLDNFNKEFTAFFHKSLNISIQFYIFLQLDSGNFPSSFSRPKKDDLVQFCHGSPGSISPLILAYKLNNLGGKFNELIQNSLEKAANNIWKNGILKKGYGLCHGISGNGYGLLHYYNFTNDPKWLYRALRFALVRKEKNLFDMIENFEFEDRYVKGKSDNPYSLMLGLSGDLLYIIHCFLPDQAKYSDFNKISQKIIRFPGYDL